MLATPGAADRQRQQRRDGRREATGDGQAGEGGDLDQLANTAVMPVAVDHGLAGAAAEDGDRPQQFEGAAPQVEVDQWVVVPRAGRAEWSAGSGRPAG